MTAGVMIVISLISLNVGGLHLMIFDNFYSVPILYMVSG